MHRIDSATAEADTHGAGKDGFTDGDPGMGIAPTDLTDDWFNTTQEEICNVVETTGMTLDKSDNTQLLRSLQVFAASNWSPRTHPKTFTLKDIIYSPTAEEMIAVGNADGSNAYLVTSQNGFNWFEFSNPKNFNLNGVVDSGSLVVAVGAADGTDAYIVTSTSGSSWTERSNPKNFTLNNVAYGAGLFVAVGEADGSDAYIVTSPDGVTWTERSNPKNIALNAIHWNGSLFLAVGDHDGSDGYMVTSPDGLTWTEQSNGAAYTLQSVAYGAGRWVVGESAGGGSGKSWVSTDGTSWASNDTGLSGGLGAIHYANGLFVMAKSPVVSDLQFLSYSFDGLTWIHKPMDYHTNAFSAVTFGLSQWFVVGSTNGGAAGIYGSLLGPY